MSDKRHIDEDTLRQVIERATEIEMEQARRVSRKDLTEIASDLGIDPAIVRQALRDVTARQSVRESVGHNVRMFGPWALAAVVVAALLYKVAEEPTQDLTVVGPRMTPAARSPDRPQRIEPRVVTPEPAREPVAEEPSPSEPISRPNPVDPSPSEPPTIPVPVVRAPPPEPSEPRKPQEPAASDPLLPLKGRTLLKPSSIVGIWGLVAYQMVMDGRSVEMPLRRAPRNAGDERETWTFRKDGTFTHRFDANLWFSGRWHLGQRVEVPTPLSPGKGIEIVQLVTLEVSTSMMRQRPVDHHLVALTPSKELITWYVGPKGPPTMRSLKQGHRFERVSGR